MMSAPHPLRFAAGLAALLTTVAPAAAIFYLIPTDEDLVRRSTVIVYGQVGASGPGPPTERFATTDFSFQVEEVLKGELELGAGGAIVVRQPGGVTPEGLTERIMGLRRLVGGDRMLLFLAPDAGAWRTVSLGLGQFVEAAAPSGSILLRDAAGQPRTAPDQPRTGANRTAGALPRNARRFRRWVRDFVDGGVRAPDYFVEDPSDELAAVISHYNLHKSEHCGRKDALERWNEFDGGGSVNIVVQRDGLPGVPNGGLAGVRKGIYAWNNHPDTKVRLTMSLSDLSNQELAEASDQHPDYLNPVLFEDPFRLEAVDFPDNSVLGWARIGIPCEAAFRGGPKDEDLLHPVPNHPEEAIAYPILRVSITTARGFAKWLADKENPDAYIAELIAHEVGHLLGIGHSCAPDPSSWTVENFEAIMRPWAHHDGRGARLSVDDLKAARELYANGPWTRGVASPPAPGEEGPEPTFDPGSAPTTNPDRDACQADGRTLCLGDREFAIEADWATSSVDGWRPSTAGRLSEATGYFWFFDRENVEVLVKVLDGCKINGHRWVFVAGLTDVAVSFEVTEFSTGLKRRYRKSNVTELMNTVRDVSAFPCAPEGAAASAASASPAGPPNLATRPGETAPLAVSGFRAATGAAPSFLINDRYEVSGEWRVGDDGGPMHGIPITRDTMGLHFFNADNTEIVIKVLDGCGENGYSWVWIAGLTDVGTELTVRDRVTGGSMVHATAPGELYGSTRNLRAFRCAAP